VVKHNTGDRQQAIGRELAFERIANQISRQDFADNSFVAAQRLLRLQIGFGASALTSTYGPDRN
jgi:hypothetical protein